MEPDEEVIPADVKDRLENRYGFIPLGYVDGDDPDDYDYLGIDGFIRLSSKW